MPKTPSKASDASEWSATMACVGGTASAARLKRPKSSAQRGDGLRGRRHPQLGRAGEFAAQTNFPDAWGRMLVARPDFGRSPQDWRPPGSSHRACSAAMEARLGWLRVCNVRTHALTKGLRPFFNQKRAPPKQQQRDDLPPSLVFNALIVLLPASIVPPCIAPVRAAELSLQLTRLCSDLASDGTSSRSE